MAQGLQVFNGSLLCDINGVLVGALGANGREYMIATTLNSSASTSQPVTYVPSAVAITGGTVNGTPVGATTPNTGAFTTLSATGATTINSLSATGTGLISLSPTGAGSVTIAPATAGTINNMSIGVTTPAIVKTSQFQVVTTDSSGTPGNVTNNSPSGRAAFAAAGSTVVVTNSLVTAASKVFVQIRNDATLKSVAVTPAAGSFTVTGNAAATAITIFDFLVVN